MGQELFRRQRIQQRTKQTEVPAVKELAFERLLRDHKTVQGQTALTSMKNGRRDGGAVVSRQGGGPAPGSLTQEHSRRREQQSAKAPGQAQAWGVCKAVRKSV